MVARMKKPLADARAEVMQLQQQCNVLLDAIAVIVHAKTTGLSLDGAIHVAMQIALDIRKEKELQS
jgi:hypothetical protein